jgi:hypothetical protein
MTFGHPLFTLLSQASVWLNKKQSCGGVLQYFVASPIVVRMVVLWVAISPIAAYVATKGGAAMVLRLGIKPEVAAVEAGGHNRFTVTTYSSIAGLLLLYLPQYLPCAAIASPTVSHECTIGVAE